MGIGISSGENRAAQAAQQAISSPLLEDVNIEGATGILINITAGKDVSLLEINEACMIIQEAAHEDANIIFGAVVEESAGDEMRVTVIATGFPGETADTQTKQELYHKRTYSQMYQKQTPSLIKKPTRNKTNYNRDAVVNTNTHTQKAHSFKFFKKEPAVTTTTSSPAPNLEKNNTAPTPTLTKPILNPKEPAHTLKTEKATPDSSFSFTADTNLNTRTKTEQEPTVSFEKTNTTSNDKKQDTSYINNCLQQDLDENIDKKIDEAL
jgi:cell division protein FtsZ